MPRAKKIFSSATLGTRAICWAALYYINIQNVPDVTSININILKKKRYFRLRCFCCV
jgi:hypothetical protein